MKKGDSKNDNADYNDNNINGTLIRIKRVPFPHLEAATAIYAHFRDMDRFPSESGEMPFVDVEVVHPLMHQPPGVVSEVLLERILSDLDNLASENGNR